MAELFIGGAVDPATHERTGTDVRLDTADLTTHGIVVGMTGSGKTGLGVVLVEEVLAAGLPALLVDPKGDLTNLCLAFPGLAPADFRPWIDEAQAREAGQSPDEFAAAQAAAWTAGLAGWGYGPDQIARLRETVEFTIYTPGSQAGTPINLVGSLEVPATDDGEAIADEVEGFVTGLLGLVGVTADPLAGREHILLSNLIHHAWDAGRSLDLPTLIAQVQQPPIDRLGVLELDEFFPAKDRQAFAVRLNGLLAAPSFAAWGAGVPLDVAALLHRSDGRPRCAIVTTAHLSDEERQFVTSLLLGKLVTWMRGQSGTTDLRALLYMDEVAGYLPPTAAPPTKKPIMTLMKQARAFGVGVVLATQNPVDIDYKAISNAGTWMVGRLQTEQDKARLLDGMSAATGGVDVAAVGDVIAGLAKREFVLRRAGRDQPEVFTTRWAMSYLRGPLTKDQIRRLQPDPAQSPAPVPAPVPASTPLPEPAAAPAGAATAMPAVAAGVAVRWIDATATGGAALGGDPAGSLLAPAVVTEVHVRYDDTKLGLAHDVTLILGGPVSGERLDPTALVDVPVDLAALRGDAPPGAAYRPGGGPIGDAAAWKRFERGLVDHVVRTRAFEVMVNPALKLASEPAETADDFRSRCTTAARERIQADGAALAAEHGERRARLADQRAAATDRAGVVAEEAADRKRGNLLKAAGDVLGGIFGSRRSAAGKIGRAADRLTDDSGDRRVDEARRKVADLDRQQADLDAALATDQRELEAKWTAAAAAITTTSVAAEKTDTRVGQLLLVWVPTA